MKRLWFSNYSDLASCARMRSLYNMDPWLSLQGQRAAPFHRAKNAAC